MKIRRNTFPPVPNRLKKIDLLADYELNDDGRNVHNFLKILCKTATSLSATIQKKNLKMTGRMSY
jgi:hypothetical protein